MKSWEARKIAEALEALQLHLARNGITISGAELRALEDAHAITASFTSGDGQDELPFPHSLDQLSLNLTISRTV
jgi:hypothetical protein